MVYALAQMRTYQIIFKKNNNINIYEWGSIFSTYDVLLLVGWLVGCCVFIVLVPDLMCMVVICYVLGVYVRFKWGGCYMVVVLRLFMNRYADTYRRRDADVCMDADS